MRAFLLLVLFTALFWALRNLFASGKTKKPDGSSTSGGEEMVKDPVCGVYVPVSYAVRKSVGGATIYFCSDRCKDLYK